MQRPVRYCVPLVTLALLITARAPVYADQVVSVPFSLPIHIAANVSELNCANSPGPQITLDAKITLGELKSELMFENNLKGTHTTTVAFETNVVLLPSSTIVIPKQPVLGGVGGNPYIWIQFLDDAGADLSGEIFLGRCVQGLSLAADLLEPAIASVDVAAADCSNNPGPVITFSGDVTMSGLNCRFIFRNNADGTHTAEATVSVSILPASATVQIPKQPVLGGSGGNPFIWLQFMEGDGTLIGAPVFLGRCVQM